MLENMNTNIMFKICFQFDCAIAVPIIYERELIFRGNKGN